MTCNGRLWKRGISFVWLQKENQKHLTREGSATMFIGERIISIEGGSSRSHYVEESFW